MKNKYIETRREKQKYIHNLKDILHIYIIKNKIILIKCNRKLGQLRETL